MKGFVLTWGMLIFGFSELSSASFENSKLRHVSPVDVIQIINNRYSYYPFNNSSEEKPSRLLRCQVIEKSNTNILGTSSPSSGVPVQSEPQKVFVNWYYDCLNSLSEERFKKIRQDSDLKALSEFIPQDLLNQYKTFEKIKTMPTSNISKVNLEKIIVYQLEKAIGPQEVLKDVKSVETFEDKVSRILAALEKNDRKTVLEAVRWISVVTMMQPEVLRY